MSRHLRIITAEGRTTHRRPAATDLGKAPRGRNSALARIGEHVDARPRVVILVAGLIAALAYVVNLTQSPDFNIDEVFYGLAAQHVSSAGSISWDAGPILVHPPLDFLLDGAWLHIFGQNSLSLLDTIDTLRYLNVIFDVLIVILIGVAYRVWSVGTPSARRGNMLLVALALAITNVFLLRFGRVALIEPFALFAALATVLLAYQLRRTRAGVYIPIVGACIGAAVLIKSPTVFLVSAPLVAAMLQGSWSGARRHLGALAVGAAVWLVFPIWAALGGSWGEFYDQQAVSIRRLLGLLHISGLNKSGSSPLASLMDTFPQYVGGYIVFCLGLLILVAGLISTFRRRLAASDDVAFLLGFGLVSYGFIVYSFAFGQANEQLTVYVVPASILLVVNGRRLLARSVTAAGQFRLALGAGLTAAAVVFGATSWFLAYWPANDNATRTVAAYLADTMPRCARVNTTGDPWHWQAAVTSAPVSAYASGPDALAADVHIFLLSDKDTQFKYGVSSPELTEWVHQNGHKVFEVESRTYRNVSVWIVGTPTAPIGSNPASCGFISSTTSDHANADVFLILFAGALGIVAVVAVSQVGRRRRYR